MLPLSIGLTLSACVTLGPPPGPGSFDSITGFGVVPIPATVAEVQSALAKARIPYGFKVFHKSGAVYITFKTPMTGPARAGGTWDATVYFNGADHLTEVLLQSPKYPRPAGAEAAVKDLLTRYGQPQKAKPEGTGVRYWSELWRNKTVTLRGSTVSDKLETEWTVTLSWRPAVAPPDASKGPAVPGELINAPPETNTR